MSGFQVAPVPVAEVRIDIHDPISTPRSSRQRWIREFQKEKENNHPGPFIVLTLAGLFFLSTYPKIGIVFLAGAIVDKIYEHDQAVMATNCLQILQEAPHRATAEKIAKGTWLCRRKQAAELACQLNQLP